MKLLSITLALLVTAACDTKTVISEGDRVGVVTKFSHKLMPGGTWNWEGELAMQGGTIAHNQGSDDGNGNQVASGVWQFSLDPKDSPGHTEVIASEVKQAMNSQHVVRVGYNQTAYHGSDRESDYMVTYVAETK